MKCIDSTFRTPVPVRARKEGLPFSLSADSRILLMGACFTDNIGTKLLECGMPATVNPAGVQYNPASIAAVLRAAMRGIVPEDSIFEHEGRTRSWLFPTRYSATDPADARRLFAATVAEAGRALMEADTLIVTFGTAWIYEHLPSALSPYSAIVGNCHKVSAAEFARRRLSVAEIAADWGALLEEIRGSRAAKEPLQVIFTVSPIRHFKDGAHQNTLSKATLHLAINEIMCSLETICVGDCPCAVADYFPAWELLMDDLRDYRFYADDMLHPSAVAVDYIWQHFCQTYFAPAALSTLTARSRSLRATRHRPLLG